MVAGLVLAGGRGSRLGGGKPFVRLLDKPLVRWVADGLRPLVDELLISIPHGTPPGPFVDALGPGVKVIPDERPGGGPLEGLRSSTPRVADPWVCVAPCDAPFITPALYELLGEEAQGREGAVPLASDLQPILGYFDAKALRAATEAVASVGEGSPRAVLATMDLVEVPLERLRRVDPDLAWLLNVNTPGDLDLAVAWARVGRPGGFPYNG